MPRKDKKVIIPKNRVILEDRRIGRVNTLWAARGDSARLICQNFRTQLVGRRPCCGCTISSQFSICCVPRVVVLEVLICMLAHGIVIVCKNTKSPRKEPNRPRTCG